MTTPADDESNINLAPPALRPIAGSPWGDDALQRQGIASELNKLVAELAHGEDSATISLDGGYGTGKTFVLERWVREMQDQERVAVYYNAWENDCDDDPLVSLIETLASDARTKKWRQAVSKALNETLYGIVRKYTGVDVGKIRKAFAPFRPVGLLEVAAARRASRRRMKELLTKLVNEVKSTEAFGVVVVIDELDRCRPTFATELLERVKHVLNVPGMVFVFGVNIIALRETVKAAYGNIDAHQYLLRMFTTTLLMPPGARKEQAKRHVNSLIDRHGLRGFCKQHRLLDAGLSEAEGLLFLVAAGGGVTPREMERIVWLLAKVASSSLLADRKAYSMLPLVLVPLAVAKIKDPDAYYATVSIPDQAPAVINCLSELIHEVQLDEWQIIELDRLEMTMYRICHQHPPSKYNSKPPACVSLDEYAKERGLKIPLALDDQHLSHRLKNIDRERAKALLELEKAPPEYDTSLILTFATLQSLTSRFDAVWPHDQGS